jgi:hypothetical protein
MGIVIYFPYSFVANKFTSKLRYCIFLGYLQFKLTNTMVKLILGCTLNINIAFMDMSVSCNTCIFVQLILSFEMLMQTSGCPWPKATVKFYKFFFFLSFTLHLAPALPALPCPLPCPVWPPCPLPLPYKM